MRRADDTLSRAIAQPLWPPEREQVKRAGRSRLVSVAARHTELLLENFQHGWAHDAAADFADTVTRYRPGMEQIPPSRGDPWHDAAELFGVAHDLLATHIGPHGRRLSPFVPGYDDDHSLRHALSRMANLTMRATIGDNPTADSRSEHCLITVRQAGFELLTRLGPTPPARQLEELEPRALAMPKLGDEPVAAATDAVRYVRQAAHPYVHGWTPVTMAIVKFTVMPAFLAHDTVLRSQRRPDQRLAAAHQTLSRLGTKLSVRPFVTPPPVDLRDAAVETSKRLRGLRIPDGCDTARLIAAAAGLADDVREMARRIPNDEIAHSQWGPSLGRRQWVPSDRQRYDKFQATLP
jgi:hypothetical protein